MHNQEVSAADLESWFWDETVLVSVSGNREQCVRHSSLEVREVGKYMIGELESEYYVRQYSGLTCKSRNRFFICKYWVQE